MFTIGLSNILAFLFAAGIIIFVHELGHYIVGRFFGVRVLVFSLGFGNRIWGFKRGETDFRIAVIPLGGYVLFDGLDPTREPREGDFSSKPRWQRILIYLAGPAMNVALAVILVAGVFMWGTEMGNRRDLTTEIGFVAPDSAASQAGLQAGDRIVAIDGEAMPDWEEVSMTFLTSPDRDLGVEYQRGTERLMTTLRPQVIPKYELGEAGVWPAAMLRVARVVEGGPAERAGFRYADGLLAVDGVPVASGEEFSQKLEGRNGERVEVEIDRHGERLILQVTPQLMEGEARIGVNIAQFQFQRFPPLEAIKQSVRYNYDSVRQIFDFVGKVFERRISAESAVGGPLEIARVSGAAARLGFDKLLMLMALISINLCLINMLPIPILDGGQILVLAVESTLRRDLSLEMKEWLIRLGLAVIFTMMLMVIFFDVKKLLPAPDIEAGAAQSTTEVAPSSEKVEPESEP